MWLEHNFYYFGKEEEEILLPISFDEEIIYKSLFEMIDDLEK